MPPDRRHRDEAGRDAALLLDMLLAAEDAQGFVADMDEAAFLASTLHQSAVIRQITIIGGGDRLVHGYGEVRLDEVWAVLDIHLPVLADTLRPLIPPDEPA